MFGFLKKKLKDAVEKISGVAKETQMEKVAEAEKEVLQEEELRNEAEEKKELVQEAGFAAPEVEDIVEKPAELIPEEKVSEPDEEILAEEREKTEVKAEEILKAEEREEKVPEAEKETIRYPPEKISAEMEKEKIAAGKGVSESLKGLVRQPKVLERPEAAEEKTVSEKRKRKKGFLERLGVGKKPEKEMLPRDFEILEDVEKREEREKAGLFRKIRKAVSEKTVEESDIRDILWELQIGLIESDVAVGAAEKISSDLKSALVGRSLPKKGIEDVVKSSMGKSVKEILDVGGIELDKKIKSKKPFLILFLGFNGVGKTTTIARMGHLLKEKGFGCIFAAADTWRAGAIQQLEEHGSRLGIKVIKQEYGSDPAAIIFDAKKYAEAHGTDVILADTAGRSHTNINLVDELKKIVRVNKPDMKILVLDALTGNDVVEQAKYFHEAAGVDGIIITKADVYEKGGALLSAVHTIRKPILYLGVGQGYDDLEEFDVDRVVEKLLE